MLKITKSSNVSKLKIRNSNNEIIEYGVGGGVEKFAKKSVKLNDQNLSKSWKTPKYKKLSKSGNLPKFNA